MHTELPAAGPAPRRPARVVSDLLTTARRRVRTVRRADGLRDCARLARMTVEGLVGRADLRAPAATAQPVRVRGATGEEGVIWLRPRSHDREALEFLHEERHHLPPPELAGPLHRIAVFGANIGLLVVDLAERHPDARIVGVEPEPDNAAMVRRNTARFGDRCRVVEAAVWFEEGEIELTWRDDAWGLSMDDRGPGAGSRTVRTVDAAALLDELSGGEPVDYVLVNIESAWYELLRHGDWTRGVRGIKIEVQDHYDEAVPMLEALGFRARLEPNPWGAYAVGVRP